jgi:hypothetical protein
VRHSHDPEYEALVAEELTSEEVRDLLERLNAQDMGGSENATVGSVVEATGSDPLTVGRLLAEIRKEDFEERFGLKLDEHGARIDSLEGRLKSVHKPVRSSQPLDHYQQVALDRLAEQERQRETMKPVAIVIIAIAIMLALLLFLAAGQQPPVTPPPPFSGR